MLNVATWIRAKDALFFGRVFTPFSQVRFYNAIEASVDFDQMDGLLLSGGADIAPEFLRQEVLDPSLLEKEPDPARDAWEFEAVEKTIGRRQPILAICKGMQLLNVALGGTLYLDIPGHNAPEMKDNDVQQLRTSSSAVHRFECVNSSHHQSVDRVADGFEVEAWSAKDDVIEQMRLRDYPFALAVQYHPERGEIYDPIFAEFVASLEQRKNL
ncbi:MAG: gamma-glutamyl-gamma-aminobutyrate hydrolase family protein [Chthoniobacterales bacterium]